MAFVDLLMVPGDRVIMKMDKESRSYQGSNFPPDGTLGTFLGRTRCIRYRSRVGTDRYFRDPGIYEGDGVAIIQWDDGSTKVDGWSHEMLDQVEYKRRFDAWHAIPDKPFEFGEHVVRIGDLPETALWEGDIVALKSGFGDRDLNRLHVDEIQYHLNQDDRGFCYQISWVDENNIYARAGSTHAHDCDLVLIERGNVWKEEHGEIPVFRDLLEEASYAKWLGRYRSVRNPASNLYSWTKDEVLSAIDDDVVDGFNLSNGAIPHVLDDKMRINAIRFKDRDLGERVRQETLRGFDRHSPRSLG